MIKSTQKIRFHYEGVTFYFPRRTEVKMFLLQLFKRENKKVEGVNYIFCTDKYLLDINRQYLNHDTYTDIITFELSAPADPVVSDIYISIDRVQENAATLGFKFSRELSRVMIHGALHLCGYKDKLKRDQTVMRLKEDYYLNKLKN